MIRREKTQGDSDEVRVVFVLPEDEVNERVSVVGEFNDWDPDSAPLIKRNNRTYSASLILPRGQSYRFRYRTRGGEWFNEPEADEQVWNTFGSQDSVLET